MPTKVCQLCHSEYWARWRNTPAVCETCVLHAIICPACWKVTLHDDPAQLSLFSSEQMAVVRATARSWERPIVVLMEPRLPHGFDWETYVDLLLNNRPARNLELLEVPPWARRASMAERMKYPFH